MKNDKRKTLILWTISCCTAGTIAGLILGFAAGRATAKVSNNAKTAEESSQTTKNEVQDFERVVLTLDLETPQKGSTNATEDTAKTTDETTTTEEPEETEQTESGTAEEEHEWLTFMATAYTNAPGENGEWGAVDCIHGEPLVDGEHIAADLSVLPYGTRVYIEGIGERTVVDTCDHLDQVNQMAADRDCDGWIDIYMGDRNEDMDDWGIKLVRLYVIE